MKKSIVSLVLLMGLSFGATANVVTATQVINTSLIPVAVVTAVYAMVTNSEITEACYNEPLRKVAWANNPNGYNFTVAGCDYQANKSRLILK